MKTFTINPEKYNKAFELYELAQDFKSQFPSCFSDNTLTRIFEAVTETKAEKENKALVGIAHIMAATYNRSESMVQFYDGSPEKLSVRFSFTEDDVDEHIIDFDSDGVANSNFIKDALEMGLLLRNISIPLPIDQIVAIRNAITTSTSYNGISDDTIAKFTEAIENYTK